MFSGRFEDIRRSADLLHDPVFEHRDPVGQRQCLTLVGRRADECRSQSRVKALQLFDGRRPLRRFDMRCGLVEQCDRVRTGVEPTVRCDDHDAAIAWINIVEYAVICGEGARGWRLLPRNHLEHGRLPTVARPGEREELTRFDRERRNVEGRDITKRLGEMVESQLHQKSIAARGSHLRLSTGHLRLA